MDCLRDVMPLMGQIFGLAVICVGIGATVGATVGFLFGMLLSIFTFGLSLIFLPLVGVLVGAAFGLAVSTLVSFRLCVGQAETLLLYHPRPYDGDERLEGVLNMGGMIYFLEPLTYRCQQRVGPVLAQHSLLLRPAQPRSGSRTSVWVVFGGNAMLAADYLPFCKNLFGLVQSKGEEVPSNVYFILFDYPGYGQNGGEPSPGLISASALEALSTVLSRLPHGDTATVNLFGHSLGCAAAAQLAAALPKPDFLKMAIGRVVLSAPFLSIPHMALHLVGLGPPTSDLPKNMFQAESTDRFMEAQRRTEFGSDARKDADPGAARAQVLRLARDCAWEWLPVLLAPFFPHGWYNTAPLQKAAVKGWEIAVVHGVADWMVPVTMGHELWQRAADALSTTDGAVPSPVFVDLPGVGHNDILTRGLLEFGRAMGMLPRAQSGRAHGKRGAA